LTPATKALFDECHRQKENCEYTALSFVIWLRILRFARNACLAAPIVFGALATWKIVAQAAPVAGAVFTLLATVIPVAYRATKTDDAIRQYQRRSGEFTNLRDDFRRVAEIGVHKEFSAFEKDTRPLFRRLERAREPMLTPPDWCFRAARKKIHAGHYHHDYDEQQGSGETP
jgi:hypothetical protein